MAHRAPKQWSLGESETITSYEAWRQNLLYCLSLDDKFTDFLAPDASWSRKSVSDPYHGLQDDPATAHNPLTKQQKCVRLELLLGQIANFCPGIARNVIVKESTSLDSVWQKIRVYYGFQRSGSHFLDLASIHLNDRERPEALFQRLNSFFHDNLLNPQNNIYHHGAKCTVEEDMSPKFQCVIAEHAEVKLPYQCEMIRELVNFHHLLHFPF